ENAVGIDRVLQIQSTGTSEQKAFKDMMHKSYREYVDDLVEYQERQEQHHHFMNQWVHSMKTPVSVTHLLIQQSVDINSSNEARELFKSIGEENDRIAHGLEMILHTARLDKFELDVALRRVGLVDLVRSV